MSVTNCYIRKPFFNQREIILQGHVNQTQRYIHINLRVDKCVEHSWIINQNERKVFL